MPPEPWDFKLRVQTSADGRTLIAQYELPAVTVRFKVGSGPGRDEGEAEMGEYVATAVKLDPSTRGVARVTKWTHKGYYAIGTMLADSPVIVLRAEDFEVIE